MSKTPVQTQDLALGTGLQQSFVSLSYLTAVNGAPSAGQFRSSVSGRANMVDLTNDLSVRMGIERVQTQQIMRLYNETGSNNEPVFKPVNDKFEQIRFIGAGWASQNASRGSVIFDSVVGDAVEVTFYGTGLNILFSFQPGTMTYNYSLNGGANIAFLSSYLADGTLNGRNYCPNNVVPVVKGLSLGLHTVKISGTTTGQYGIAGFEFVNESSSVKTSAGSALVDGKKRVLSALDSSSYNSGFTNVYGTAGARGSRVLTYMKSDGTIAKDVQYVNTSSATLSSADHTNEEVVRNYFWREFGNGRSDDFSTLTPSSSPRVFLLDDGTTSLITDNCVAVLNNNLDSVSPRGSGSIIFTFVGTGLDLLRVDDSNGGSDTYTFYLDGSLILTQTAGSTVTRITKIASGLPYGTHTLRIVRVSAVTWNPYISNFIVYGPKKPALPVGAIELSDYSILANYIANTVGGVDTIGTGLLRKTGHREFVRDSGSWGYNNSGILSGVANHVGGLEIYTNQGGVSVNLTFFGTGFEIRGKAGASSSTTSSATLTVDGIAPSGVTTSTYGGWSYSGNTINMRVSDSVGAGMTLTGLPLGIHTVKILNNAITGNNMYIDAIDVITPIHVHKNNGPFTMQNVMSVGSQGVNDGRVFLASAFTGKKFRNTSQSTGLTSGPSVTSTSAFVPMTDMSCVADCQTGLLNINFVFSWANGTPASLTISFFIDGVPVGTNMSQIDGNSTPGWNVTTPLTLLAPVSVGRHVVQVMWKTGSTQIDAVSTHRILTVTDIG